MGRQKNKTVSQIASMNVDLKIPALFGITHVLIGWVLTSQYISINLKNTPELHYSPNR